MFPPLVAIPLYNTHFWSISWTGDSLVTFKRLINVHFGIKGEKRYEGPVVAVSGLAVQARLGKQIPEGG